MANAQLRGMRTAAFLLLILACVTGGRAMAELVNYAAPKDEAPSPDYRVKASGQDVFVYHVRKDARTEDPEFHHLGNSKYPVYFPAAQAEPASFAYFDADGEVRVEVSAERDIKSAVVRPLSAGIKTAVAGRTVSFTLARPGNYSLELNNSIGRPLYIFANPLEKDAPRPDDPNVMYFGPGVHEIDSRKISSNTTIYIAGGAIVRGKIMPEETFKISSFCGQKVYSPLLSFTDVSNVTVRGRGILDTSSLPWHSKHPMKFMRCTDVRVEGIIMVDSPSWCMPQFECRKTVIRNVKQICHRLNSDGINIVNSQDALVEGCFLRNNDDEICVKTTLPPPHLEAKNITVKDCVVWNDRALALGITYETRSAVSNVLFSNCDVIHDHGAGALVIHVSDSGTISDVRFEDIRVEDCRKHLIKLWIGKDMWGKSTERGRIRNVSFKNISVGGKSVPSSQLAGADAEHAIDGVRIENLEIGGKKIATPEAGKFSVNAFVKRLEFHDPKR